ncbi:MAG: DUF3313 family protein [Parvularculaceae bacterium]
MTLLRIGAAAAVVLAAATTIPTAVSARSFDEVALTTDKQLASYEAVYIAPVKAELNLDVRQIDRSGSGDRPISDRDIADKISDFQRELERAFSRSFDLADAPGPGVLTIEATLTDLASTRPTMAEYSRRVSLDFRSVYVGRAEASFVLSGDGEVLATLSDRYVGSFTDGRPRIATWDDADYAFDSWARKLVKFVERN